MKQLFIVVSLSVWTVALLIGLGFAVVGEVTAINDLPMENQALKKLNQELIAWGADQEAKVVLAKATHAAYVIKMEGFAKMDEAHFDELIAASLQRERVAYQIVFCCADSKAALLGPWPREE